jgi:hypothetical protein
MTRLRAFAIAALFVPLAACATQTTPFEWGSYDTALYTYYKKAENRDGYEKALTKAIERGRATKRLAPGLLAELGYLHLEAGRPDKAISYFEEEMAAFPESRAFLERVIKQIRAGDSAVALASVRAWS